MPEGKYTVEYWKDGKKVNIVATDCEHQTVTISSAKPIAVKLANAGGYVCIISKK